MFVIVRHTRQGARYVAPAGSPRAYVPDLTGARTWASREAAVKDCCVGNERVVSVYELLSRGS